MNELIIQEAQDYLIVRQEEDKFKRILDIRHLLEKHSVEEVTDFLKQCLRDKEKALRNMILIDKSNRRIDKFAGAIFRIFMAIKVLEGKEVNIIERSESGAAESGCIQKRNSGGHKRGRFRQDKNDDGTDRVPGYAAQRHA